MTVEVRQLHECAIKRCKEQATLRVTTTEGAYSVDVCERHRSAGVREVKQAEESW